MDTNNVIIRDATRGDLAAIQAIYAYHVLHGLGTFEEEVPSLDEMERRFDKVTQTRAPYLVAEIAGIVVGYAYGGSFRERSAYRFTVEDSIYVANDYHGFGIGQKLLHVLIEKCRQCGFRQMVAVIGDSNNQSSIGLHAKFGFRHCGIMTDAGYKFSQWVDVVIMELKLN